MIKFYHIDETRMEHKSENIVGKIKKLLTRLWERSIIILSKTIAKGRSMKINFSLKQPNSNCVIYPFEYNQIGM